MMITPVILCGGSGTRLWPVSRRQRPKQLVQIFDGWSLFQKTLNRFSDAGRYATPIVVAADSVRFIAAQQAAEIGVSISLLIEPEPRDTFPAILAGVMFAARENPDSAVIVSPSDHEIGDADAFHSAVDEAAKHALADRIAILGIVPERPETGFGYILPKEMNGKAGPVERFVEKPDLETAERFIAEGYLWNGGYVCVKPSMLDGIATERDSATADAVKKALANAREDLDFVRLDTAFGDANKISFDIAVMEKTENAVVVPVDMAWSDMGDWNGYWTTSDRDADGNVITGDVILRDCRDTVAFSESRLVCAVGVERLSIVETSDAILVASLEQAQSVKSLVAELEAMGREEATIPPRVHRPWGWYQTVDLGPRFRVKRISVKPGASLSLQKHFHRAEHWVGVSGTAEVTVGDRIEMLRENESVYIPIGEVHRLSNPGRIPVEIIEVQTGAYLEEDDIVRLEDTFGRAS